MVVISRGDPAPEFPDERRIGMEKRFQMLRIIGVIFRVIGALIGVITLIVVLSMVVSSLMQGPSYMDYGMAGPTYTPMMLLGGLGSSWIVVVFLLVYGGINAVSFYAVGEGIFLFIALEENTRKTAALLQQATQPRQPAEAARPKTT
jgi:hypothetical protein